MNRIDWQYLRNAIIVFAALFVMFGGMAWTVREYYQKANDEFGQQQREFTAAKRRFEEARRNRAVYQQYLNQYRQYMDRGVIGPEQRLSWIEQLQALNREYKMSSLRYDISPQEQAELPALDPSGNIALYVSTMSLQAGLLHEGDAITLWRDFRSQAKGYYALKACSLDSSDIGPDAPLNYSPGNSYVQMNCELDWYTISVNGS